MNETIKAVFKDKLTPAIAPEVKALGAIRSQRADLKKQTAELTAKIEASQAGLQAAKEKAEAAILDGSAPTQHLRTAELRQAEIDAFTRKRDQLVAADTEAGGHEQTALKALTGSIHAALIACRADVETKAREHLETALGLMAGFEDAGVDTFKAHGTWDTVTRDQEAELGRFLTLSGLWDSFEGFCSPIGTDLSKVKRREVRDRLRAG